MFLYYNIIMRCNCASKSSVRFQELGWNVKLLVATIETIETMMVTVSTIVNIINVVIPPSGFIDMNYVIDKNGPRGPKKTVPEGQNMVQRGPKWSQWIQFILSELSNRFCGCAVGLFFI